MRLYSRLPHWLPSTPLPHYPTPRLFVWWFGYTPPPTGWLLQFAFERCSRFCGLVGLPTHRAPRGAGPCRSLPQFPVPGWVVPWCQLQRPSVITPPHITVTALPQLLPRLRSHAAALMPDHLQATLPRVYGAPPDVCPYRAIPQLQPGCARCPPPPAAHPNTGAFSTTLHCRLITGCGGTVVRTPPPWAITVEW